MLDPKICERARLARDSRFDGVFYTAVSSTGIYCRPICPAPPPRPENVVYFPTASAAAEAGFRPCLRCRPEAAPGTPAWNGASTTVARAMTLIREGALNENGVEELALKLGVGGRHLRRLFKQHLGASPSAVAMTNRVLFAKKLVHETDMPMTEIGLASGFGSIRRFNAAFRKVYGKSPSDFRKKDLLVQEGSAAAFQCALMLPYSPPYDWPGMLSFFRHRIIPGVECVANGVYHRTVRLNETRGWISVDHAEAKNALRLTVRLTDSRDLMALVERVRRIFDLDASMTGIARVFQSDAILSGPWEKHKGLRLPGAWDPFEMAVRAVVGQQISVKAACTVAGRIARLAGEKARGASSHSLTHYFPAARELLRADPSAIGMPGKRKQTLWGLAKSVADEEIRLRVSGELDDFIRRITRLPGIGEWTANYIAMRGLGEPDAFPAGDLGIVKALTTGDARPTRARILERAEAWRPWRAYAAIYLWQSL